MVGNQPFHPFKTGCFLVAGGFWTHLVVGGKHWANICNLTVRPNLRDAKPEPIFSWRKIARIADPAARLIRESPSCPSGIVWNT